MGGMVATVDYHSSGYENIRGADPVDTVEVWKAYGDATKRRYDPPSLLRATEDKYEIGGEGVARRRVRSSQGSS